MVYPTVSGFTMSGKLGSSESVVFFLLFCFDEWLLGLHQFLANQICLDIEFQKKNDLSGIYQPDLPFSGPLFAEKSYSMPAFFFSE